MRFFTFVFSLLNFSASSYLFFGMLILRSGIYVHRVFHTHYGMYLFSMMGESFKFKENSLLVDLGGNRLPV